MSDLGCYTRKRTGPAKFQLCIPQRARNDDSDRSHMEHVSERVHAALAEIGTDRQTSQTPTERRRRRRRSQSGLRPPVGRSVGRRSVKTAAAPPNGDDPRALDTFYENLLTAPPANEVESLERTRQHRRPLLAARKAARHRTARHSRMHAGHIASYYSSLHRSKHVPISHTSPSYRFTAAVRYTVFFRICV